MVKRGYYDSPESILPRFVERWGGKRGGSVRLYHGGEEVEKFDLEHYENEDEPCIFLSADEETARDFTKGWVTAVDAFFDKVYVTDPHAWLGGRVPSPKVLTEAGFDAIYVVGDEDFNDDDWIWRHDVYCVLNPDTLRIVDQYECEGL